MEDVTISFEWSWAKNSGENPSNRSPSIFQEMQKLDLAGIGKTISAIAPLVKSSLGKSLSI
jgi:hypothetical protein